MWSEQSLDSLGNQSGCLVRAADSTHSWNVVFLEEATLKGRRFDSHCVSSQVREKPAHWQRGNNLCVCVHSFVRSGYGQTGPQSQSPGYDSIASAVSGMMHITGPEVRLFSFLLLWPVFKPLQRHNPSVHPTFSSRVRHHNDKLSWSPSCSPEDEPFRF